MSHDIIELKESLTIDDIMLLLTELGAENVHYNERRNEIITNTICHNKSGGSHKLYYMQRTNMFRCFTECSCKFDIYDLIIKVYKTHDTEVSFRDAVEYVKYKTRKTDRLFDSSFLLPNEVKKNEELAYFKRFKRNKKVEFSEPQTHDDKILEVFSSRHHETFYNDGISHEVLNAFDIKFYDKENAVIIPHRYYKNGKIIGIKMRNLDEWKIESGYKYIPVRVQGTLYNHASYSNLYGLWENKLAINRLKKIAIFESEKSVMQMATMFGLENNYAIALSGKNINQYQISILMQLDIEEVILCLDKEYRDVDDLQAFIFKKKLVELGRRFSNFVRVYTIWDKDGLLDYKDSPTDKDAVVFEQLLQTKEQIWCKF
ncbi:hypothetical protein NSQ62_08310 [Solibacillus sp. FSL H8-0523]|uniref:hypothetical protein n=1 Tax=Solibacillus sp. FSL H8-0523 TaxID=2954511 RepID=UPI003101A86D